MDAAICFPQGRVHTGDTVRGWTVECGKAWTLQHAAPMQMPYTLFFWTS